jgi:hypothetical protein
LGADLFHADRETDRQTDKRRTGGYTDMTEVIVSLRNFANMAKKSQKKQHQYRLRRHGERYEIMFHIRAMLAYEWKSCYYYLKKHGYTIL